jgi:succinoglycan biosynthesis transport protein ExoP
MTINDMSTFENKNILAFRNLRKIVSTQGKGIIAITSIDIDSTVAGVAIELAKALQIQQKSVLLIDCDLKHPSVHEWLAIPNHLGIIDSISSAGLVAKRNMLSVKICEDATLNVVPCESVAGRSEVLASPQASLLLLSYKGEFDYVVLSLPPLKTSFESLELMSIADQIYVCFTPLRNTRSEIDGLMQLLEFSNIEIDGWISSEAKLEKYDYFSRFFKNR